MGARRKRIGRRRRSSAACVEAPNPQRIACAAVCADAPSLKGARRRPRRRAVAKATPAQAAWGTSSAGARNTWSQCATLEGQPYYHNAWSGETAWALPLGAVLDRGAAVGVDMSSSHEHAMPHAQGAHRRQCRAVSRSSWQASCRRSCRTGARPGVPHVGNGSMMSRGTANCMVLRLGRSMHRALGLGAARSSGGECASCCMAAWLSS